MKIDKHTVPSLTYKLVVDGELVEETDKNNPLVFLAGVGTMIPGFERQLMGLKEGDSYSFDIDPAEGYGELNPEAVVEIPKDVFKVEGEVQNDILVVGNKVPMQDNQGRPLQGTVVEVADESVKMDFNHELAGKKLNFSGEVIEVREASQEEIDHGHVHGPNGHQH